MAGDADTRIPRRAFKISSNKVFIGNIQTQINITVRTVILIYYIKPDKKNPERFRDR